MQNNIHPKYIEITATCSCGNIIRIFSTLSCDFHLDVCNLCHPFYTGKQRMIDPGGRIDRFNKRYESFKKK